jgi:hypothetical protein
MQACPGLRGPRDLARRRLVLNADEADDPTGPIADRIDHQVVPEQLAILAIVDYFPTDGVSDAKSLANFGNHLAIRAGTLEKPAIAPDGLLRRVAGKNAEGLVDEDDRIICNRGIAENERTGCRRHRGRQILSHAFGNFHDTDPRKRKWSRIGVQTLHVPARQGSARPVRQSDDRPG